MSQENVRVGALYGAVQGGRHDGVREFWESWLAVWVRDGKVTASCMAETRAAALEAVGLTEP